MLRIKCPHCGERDHSEFRYHGDASRQRPALGEGDQESWYDFTFNRPNPRGPHKEYWQHVMGCRQWLVVERDTVSHDVISVEAAAARSAGGGQ